MKYLIESLFFWFFLHSFVAFWPDSSDYCHDMASHLCSRLHVLDKYNFCKYISKKIKKAKKAKNCIVELFREESYMWTEDHLYKKPSMLQR